LEYICTIHNSDERLFELLCEYLVQNGIITDPEMMAVENSDQRLLCQKMITSILTPQTINYPIQRIQSFTNDRYHNDFIELEKVGKGGFGTVFKAYNKLDSGLYAIKKINITKLSDQSNNYYLDEVKYLAKLSHPNIVRYYGTWIDCRMVNGLVQLILYIQMEFCDSSLDHYLMDRNYSGVICDYHQERDIFGQIVKGLKYIHKNGIIHGDLSPGNIFLSNEIVKIGDFGLAKQFNNEDPIVTRSYGNQLYLAPERSQNHICSKKSDIYSLGIIFLELFMPFKTIMEKMITIETVRKGRYDSLTLSSNQLSLLKSMTELDHQRRISIEELYLYQHNFDLI
jgi:serine/threonine protein kinase